MTPSQVPVSGGAEEETVQMVAVATSSGKILVRLDDNEDESESEGKGEGS